ncbi:MAG TPA: hypothetical protein V6C46_03995 [Coleofasciculaceae cyanobacterium]
MDLSRLVVQLIIAIACALLANVLIPRQIPGRFLGLILTGLVGVWLGEVGYQILQTNYGLRSPFLAWNIQGVPIIPSVIASALVIYILTTVARGGRP